MMFTHGLALEPGTTRATGSTESHPTAGSASVHVALPPWVDEDMFLDPPSEMFATFGESGVPSGQQDPWIFNDPWGGYQGRQPANRPEPAGQPTTYGPLFGPAAVPPRDTGLLFGPNTTPTYTGAWGSNHTEPPPQQQTQEGDTIRVEAGQAEAHLCRPIRQHSGPTFNSRRCHRRQRCSKVYAWRVGAGHNTTPPQNEW